MGEVFPFDMSKVGIMNDCTGGTSFGQFLFHRVFSENLKGHLTDVLASLQL